MIYVYAAIACACGLYAGNTKFEQLVVWALVLIVFLLGAILDRIKN